MAAKRTPFGTYGGKFVKTSATELGTVAAKAALAAGNVNPEIVDSVIYGNVLSVSLVTIIIYVGCSDVDSRSKSLVSKFYIQMCALLLFLLSRILPRTALS